MGSALPRAHGARDHDRRESDPVLGAGADAAYTTNKYDAGSPPLSFCDCYACILALHLLDNTTSDVVVRYIQGYQIPVVARITYM